MTPALDIRNLQKTYNNGFVALKGIDLQVQQGDFFALLGPNGAGKSTTIGIVTSLVRKTQGQIHVLGHNMDAEPAQAKRLIGLVPQEVNFGQFEKPINIVLNQGGYYGLPRALVRERAERYLKQLDLWDKRNVQARRLSGGMKRRLMIARSLIHEPKLLILDEPTAGVDIEIRRSMWEFLQQINQQGTTIILTTHYLEEAENLCRNIAIIDHGQIVENTSVRELLDRLDTETFVLYLRKPLTQLPTYNNIVLRQVDATTLELDINKEASINGVFQAMSEQGIEVLSMRNKTNRLEELFLRMVKQKPVNA